MADGRFWPERRLGGRFSPQVLLAERPSRRGGRARARPSSTACPQGRQPSERKSNEGPQ